MPRKQQLILQILNLSGTGCPICRLKMDHIKNTFKHIIIHILLLYMHINQEDCVIEIVFQICSVLTYIWKLTSCRFLHLSPTPNFIPANSYPIFQSQSWSKRGLFSVFCHSYCLTHCSCSSQGGDQDPISCKVNNS